MSAEDVELIVHDDGRVTVPTRRYADVRIRRPGLQLGALVLAGPSQDDVHKLTLRGESTVGVELVFPDHGGGADEVALGIREHILLIAGIEVLHDVARRGGCRVAARVGAGGPRGSSSVLVPGLLAMRGGAGATLGLLVASDCLHEFRARVAQGYTTRRSDLKRKGTAGAGAVMVRLDASPGLASRAKWASSTAMSRGA